MVLNAKHNVEKKNNLNKDYFILAIECLYVNCYVKVYFYSYLFMFLCIYEKVPY